MKPSQIRVQAPGICTATLGRAELEMVAAIIVLFHWEHGLEEWTPVSRRRIADWIPQSRHLRSAAANPFFRPDIAGFVAGGWIDGWEGDADAPGMVTAKFIECVSNPRIDGNGGGAAA